MILGSKARIPRKKIDVPDPTMRSLKIGPRLAAERAVVQRTELTDPERQQCEFLDQLAQIDLQDHDQRGYH